jgi:hypothetical protein
VRTTNRVVSGRTSKDASDSIWPLTMAARGNADTPAVPSRVELNPIRLAKTRQTLFGHLQWPPAGMLAHWHSRVEASRVPRVLTS